VSLPGDSPCARRAFPAGSFADLQEETLCGKFSDVDACHPVCSPQPLLQAVCSDDVASLEAGRGARWLSKHLFTMYLSSVCWSRHKRAVRLCSAALMSSETAPAGEDRGLTICSIGCPLLLCYCLISGRSAATSSLQNSFSVRYRDLIEGAAIATPGDLR
jgi:hypothetical protein